MKTFLLLICNLFIFTTLFGQGHLMIIGGGKRPELVMKKFVELAGGSDARIAIIPMASAYYLESGTKYEQEFLKYGAAEAKAFFILDSLMAENDSIADELSTYDAVFFGGGDQNKLTAIFLGTACYRTFLQLYRQGKVLGGTSAGAAIMSRIMITGDGNWETISVDSVKTANGFGFLQNVVVDQHFIKRSRLNRLISVCLQHRISGVGIDESTALLVKPDLTAEILGESSVIVLDLSSGDVSNTGNLLKGKNIGLHVLTPGHQINLNDL
ncbi:MAG: cyanophycinase [Calditrichia bacterium]